MAADRWDEQVGSVAGEAARLLESLRRASAEQDTAGGADTLHEGHGAHRAPSPGPDPVPDSTSDPDSDPDPDLACQWCPLCRSAAAVRSLSPETLSSLADLAIVAAGVLADLAARPGPTEAGTAGTGAADEPGGHASRRPAATPPPSRPVTVVDIDVSEEEPHA